MVRPLQVDNAHYESCYDFLNVHWTRREYYVVMFVVFIKVRIESFFTDDQHAVKAGYLARTEENTILSFGPMHNQRD